MSEAYSIVEYREVPGFPDYKAGTDGTIWSRKKRARTKSSEKSEVLGPEWRKLKGGWHGKYLGLQLYRGSDVKSVLRHHVILETFVGPCPEGMECCHGDGIKTNCRLDNLRWDTRGNNNRDRAKHGVGNQGERHPLTSFSESDIREIRNGCKKRGDQTQMAKRFNVSESTIHRIVKRESWGHVGN